jgi:hypothetical protein
MSPDTTILPDVRIVCFFDHGVGGSPGGVGGSQGGPKLKLIKIYEDPKRPHNSGFWIGMTPRDGRDGRGGCRGAPGGPGGAPGGSPGGVPGGVSGGVPGSRKSIQKT